MRFFFLTNRRGVVHCGRDSDFPRQYTDVSAGRLTAGNSLSRLITPLQPPAGRFRTEPNMAHSSLLSHWKLAHMVSRLNIEVPHAVGCLECLWWSAWDCLAVGRDGILHDWSASKIAKSSRWSGDSSVFVEALIDSEFLHFDGTNYRIHDYWQWAPDYIRRRIIRHENRKSGHDRTCPVMTARNPVSAPPPSNPVTQLPGNPLTKGAIRPTADADRQDRQTLVLKSEPEPTEKPKAAREPNPLWDALAGRFFPSGVAASDQRRLGRAVAELKAKNAKPEDIPARIEAYRKVFPDCGVTLEAIVKHWDAGAANQKPKVDLSWYKPRGGSK